MPSFSQYCPHVSQCYSTARVFKDGFKGLMIHSYVANITNLMENHEIQSVCSK